MAEKLEVTKENMDIAGQRLREGRLVSFPTETVYGLGANALDESAAKKIFETKGRPPTDPLIVHVPSIDQAPSLWGDAPEVVELAMEIGKALWPGPITLVAKAAEKVPNAVTGGSGCVGVRVPDHPVAIELLKAAQVPVAAPSANTFGHVSPTTAEHVLADLALRDPTLTVVDGGSCTIGIESTVVKVSTSGVEVLRRGKVSVAALQEVVKGRVPITIRDTRSKHKKEDEAMDGPGQLLTHYSPSVPAYLLVPSSLPDSSSSSYPDWAIAGVDDSVASKTVVIDFGSCLSKLQSKCLAYRNLSDSGNSDEACHDVFEALRWCETVDGAEAVVLPMASEFYAERCDDLVDAVEDRLFRAASGQVVKIVVKE